MSPEKLKIAKQEAVRFLDRVKAYETFIGSGPGFLGSKKSGAVRRASMDLTRALAELRKPN